MTERARGVDDIRWVLERLATHERPNVADASLVLIGGQALNYWCDLYQEGCPELAQHGPFASKDLDFQATRDFVPWCATLLGGKYSLAQSGDNSLLNGVVHVPDDQGGEPLQIDFLQRPYGLPADKTVAFSATVLVHTPMATVGMRVMHPLHCLISRVHNVIGLPAQYANDHGFSQLKAAIVCLRLFIGATAEKDAKYAQRLNEQLFKVALHDNEAARLLASQRIDVFDAASTSEKLGEGFLTIRYPQMLEELRKRRKR